jgi:hypothetical protein
VVAVVEPLGERTRIQLAPPLPLVAEVTGARPGIEPGGGRVAACLKQNVHSLSFHCKVKLAEARSAR